MPIDTPSYDQIVERMRADVSNELPDIDPTIYGSFASAFVVSNAGRHYDNILLLEQLVRMLFPQTAVDEFLEMWAQYEGLSRLPAFPATGNITVTGVAGTAVAALTEWRTADNKIVASLSGVNLAVETISVSSRFKPDPQRYDRHRHHCVGSYLCHRYGDNHRWCGRD